MHLFVRIYFLTLAMFATSGLVRAAPASDELFAERMAFWDSRVALCNVGPYSFPTKSTVDPSQPCDDGDMTLFNGLLCIAGDERGCQGVIDAQNPETGQWFRSPRIRLLGHNDRGDASFSPDMALGVQLYLVKSGDTDRAMKWAMWLTGLPHKDFPISWVNNFNWMTGYSIAWFCTEQVGCVVRPGDAASLAHTFDYLHDKKDMPILPDGSLRGTAASWARWGWLFTWLSSNLNKPGYSQHLLGVEILLQRAISGNKEALKDEAVKLAGRPENEGNAFFSYLAGKDRAEVMRQTLDRCPSPTNLPTPPLFQWQWERDNEVQSGHLPASKQSCYWDCIFMGKLLGF